MKLYPIRMTCSQDAGEVSDEALPELLGFLALSCLAESHGQISLADQCVWVVPAQSFAQEGNGLPLKDLGRLVVPQVTLAVGQIDRARQGQRMRRPEFALHPVKSVAGKLQRLGESPDAP